MITLYPELCKQMRDHNISYRGLAAIAEVNIVTLHLKLMGLVDWRLPECIRIAQFLHYPDLEVLFLRKYNKRLFRKSQENCLNIQRR